MCADGIHFAVAYDTFVQVVKCFEKNEIITDEVLKTIDITKNKDKI